MWIPLRGGVGVGYLFSTDFANPADKSVIEVNLLAKYTIKLTILLFTNSEGG